MDDVREPNWDGDGAEVTSRWIKPLVCVYTIEANVVRND